MLAERNRAPERESDVDLVREQESPLPPEEAGALEHIRSACVHCDPAQLVIAVLVPRAGSRKAAIRAHRDRKAEVIVVGRIFGLQDRLPDPGARLILHEDIRCTRIIDGWRVATVRIRVIVRNTDHQRLPGRIERDGRAEEVIDRGNLCLQHLLLKPVLTEALEYVDSTGALDEIVVDVANVLTVLVLRADRERAALAAECNGAAKIIVGPGIGRLDHRLLRPHLLRVAHEHIGGAGVQLQAVFERRADSKHVAAVAERDRDAECQTLTRVVGLDALLFRPLRLRVTYEHIDRARILAFQGVFAAVANAAELAVLDGGPNGERLAIAADGDGKAELIALVGVGAGEAPDGRQHRIGDTDRVGGRAALLEAGSDLVFCIRPIDTVDSDVERDVRGIGAKFHAMYGRELIVTVRAFEQLIARGAIRLQPTQRQLLHARGRFIHRRRGRHIVVLDRERRGGVRADDAARRRTERQRQRLGELERGVVRHADRHRLDRRIAGRESHGRVLDRVVGTFGCRPALEDRDTDCTVAGARARHIERYGRTGGAALHDRE